MTESPMELKTFPQPSFAVVLPYYNEAKFLEHTLLSWLNQERKPDQLILVNNGSTDASESVAREVLKEINSIDVKFLHESRPGKLFALDSGCRAVTCQFVALSDADTYYPPHYLGLCESLMAGSSAKVSVLLALPEFDRPGALISRLRRWYFIGMHQVFRKHLFTGGYGQVFRVRALREAGGFSGKIWPYVLMDHEIMVRIFQRGLSRYHIDLWCQSSTRRRSRRSVRWNLWERILYQLVPYPFHNWFFYRFLGPRFKKRGLDQLKLREQPWQKTRGYPK
jgi:glycosyltransferase involved in cell wall biosynthesis